MKKRALQQVVSEERPAVLAPIKQGDISILNPTSVEETLHEAYRTLCVAEFYLQSISSGVVPMDPKATRIAVEDLVKRAAIYVQAVSEALPYAASEIQPWKAGAR